MRDRVFGIETEYAVIYHPGRHEAKARGALGAPSNLALYPRFEAALRQRIRSLPAAFSPLRGKGGRFLENGASFHYEATPEDYEQGLLEMASPECRDPYTLLEYERAKDDLIEELCRDVNGELARAGFSGELRIGKNNVDSAGHTFGSHESYWVDDRMPMHRKLLFLPVWLALWIPSLPVLAWVLAAQLALVVVLIAVGLVLAAGLLALALTRPRVARRLALWAERRFGRVESVGTLTRSAQRLVSPLFPLLALHSRVYDRFHFREIRRGLTAHLVTRTLYTGAGAVRFDGGPLFQIAQRPPFLRSLARVFPAGDERPIFELRDLFFRPWSALRSRRRLHLMVGDANLCEWALALRVGTTSLVLEAIESARPEDWPELADPLEALRTLSANPDARLRLTDGRELDAISIQRHYLKAVRETLTADREPTALWKARVLREWEETLDLLESDPDALADRVDWIAKLGLVLRQAPDEHDRATLEARGRLLVGDLEGEGARFTPEDRRLRELAFRVWRTDLRYHELGARGGFRRLESRGSVRRLTRPERVERARTEPPEDTRAFARGQAIKWAHRHALPGAAAWHRVRLGKLDWRWFTNPLNPGPRLESRPEREPD